MAEYLSIPGYVPVAEAARLLGLSPERVCQHLRAGHLPYRRVSGRYLIPLEAVQTFRRHPHGRTRKAPPPWKVFRTGTTVHTLSIEVAPRAGCEQRAWQRLAALATTQEHTFPGTMQRYILASADEPSITLMLIWKDTEAEMCAIDAALERFKHDFADVLDWQHANARLTQAIAYT
jgi:excisionase family DNA binding protein